MGLMAPPFMEGEIKNCFDKVVELSKAIATATDFATATDLAREQAEWLKRLEVALCQYDESILKG